MGRVLRGVVQLGRCWGTRVCLPVVGRLLAQQDEQEDISAGLGEQQWDKKLPEPLSWRSDEEDEDSDFAEEQRDCYLKVLWRRIVTGAAVLS